MMLSFVHLFYTLYTLFIHCLVQSCEHKLLPLSENTIVCGDVCRDKGFPKWHSQHKKKDMDMGMHANLLTHRLQRHQGTWYIHIRINP